MNTTTNLAHNIHTFRLKAGLSQQNLADKLYVTQQTINKWENGSSIPQTDKIQDIAKVLNISIAQLFITPSDALTKQISINTTNKCSKNEKNTYANKIQSLFKENTHTYKILMTEMEYETWINIQNTCPTISLDDYMNIIIKNQLQKIHNH